MKQDSKVSYNYNLDSLDNIRQYITIQSLDYNYTITLINILTLVKIPKLIQNICMTKPSKVIEQKYCPIIRPTSLIGDTWVLLIVKELLNGPKRFSEIQKAIPEVTSRTLTQRLKDLCEAGLLIRTQQNTIPPRVDYELTTMGYGMKSIIDAIEEFGNKWMC